MNQIFEKQLEKFFSSPAYGVVGASNNRAKFGNKVLRVYIQHHKKVYPINPNESEIEGIAALSSVADLPPEVKSISIITPPPITEKIVQAAIAKGIENIWMQPGAEHAGAIEAAERNHINVIANGPCIIVTLGLKPD